MSPVDRIRSTDPSLLVVDPPPDGAGPAPPSGPPAGHRRRGSRTAAAVCLVALAGAGLWIGLARRSGEGNEGARTIAASPNTAEIARRDLVEREDVDGTLGYAGARAVTNQLEGTLTRMRSEGSVVGRGQWLYEVDGRPAAWHAG